MPPDWKEVDEKLQGIAHALELRPPDWSRAGSFTEEVAIRLPGSTYEPQPDGKNLETHDLVWDQIDSELTKLSAAIQQRQHAAAAEHLQTL